MKKISRPLALLLALLTFLGARSICAQENSEEEVGISQTLTSQNQLKIQYKTFDDYMNATIPTFLSSSQGIGMAIGVIQDGQVKSYYFGETAKGNGKKPKGSTLFMIGSISKVFTSTLLALFQQNHLVNLSDPLQQYVPAGVTVPFYNNDSSHPITLETLATHTSGLPRKPPTQAGPNGVTPEQLFNSLNQTTLGSEPGTKYLYSNYAFGLLGQALARAGKKSFAELVLTEVDAPLGLSDTKVGGQLDQNEKNRLAQGYDARGNPAPYEMPGFPAGNPAGGLYSTLDDMMKFLSFAVGLQSSSLNSLRPLLFTPLHPSQPTGGRVALGWQINSFGQAGNHVIWKNGSVNGFEAYIGFVPETRNGVVLLLNFHSKQMNPLGTEILNNLIAYKSVPNPAQISGANPIQVNQGPAGPGPVEKQTPAY